MSEIITVAAFYRTYTEHFPGLPCPSMMPWVAAVLFLGLSGCAAVPDSRCSAGLLPMTQAELFFGLSLGAGGQIGDAAWQRFADDEITSRFPDGLTIEDARGQWKGASGIVGEGAKHLIIVLPSRETAKLDAIRAAYKSRFHQDSVLLVESPVCGSF